MVTNSVVAGWFYYRISCRKYIWCVGLGANYDRLLVFNSAINMGKRRQTLNYAMACAFPRYLVLEYIGFNSISTPSADLYYQYPFLLRMVDPAAYGDVRSRKSVV